VRVGQIVRYAYDTASRRWGGCVSAWPRDRGHLASGANSKNPYAVGVAAQSPESRQRTPGHGRAPSSFLRRRRCRPCEIAEDATPPRRVWGFVVILRCNTFGVGCNGVRRNPRSALPRLRALRYNAFGVRERYAEMLFNLRKVWQDPMKA